jgi:hypothetical protein
MPVDLLSKIREEIDERLHKLRPLIAEYEGLLVAADALVATGEGEDGAGENGAVTEPTLTPTKRLSRPARVARARRGSAAGAIKRAAGTNADTMLDGRGDGKEVKPAATRATRKTAGSVGRGAGATAKEKPASSTRGVARETILAALEHGSHTVGELAVVTAMSGPSINGHLRRLVVEGAVVKTEREGKTAWSLPDIAA